MPLNREKRGHYNQLRAASHLEADLALLASIDPKNELLVKPLGKEQKYADNVLYELLTLTSSTDIIAFRRKFAKEKLQDLKEESLDSSLEAAKTNLSEELQEKQSELEDKEDELLSKESDLDDKETELSEKEDLLNEKEAELAVKETDLNNKATVEKKSVSKKKNTRK